MEYVASFPAGSAEFLEWLESAHGVLVVEHVNLTRPERAERVITWDVFVMSEEGSSESAPS